MRLPQHEIHDPVLAGEGDGWLGPFLGEGVEAGSLAAGKHECEHAKLHHLAPWSNVSCDYFVTECGCCAQSFQSKASRARVRTATPVGDGPVCPRLLAPASVDRPNYGDSEGSECPIPRMAFPDSDRGAPHDVRKARDSPARELHDKCGESWRSVCSSRLSGHCAGAAGVTPRRVLALALESARTRPCSAW